MTPPAPAIVLLTAGGLDTARSIAAALPGARLHAPLARVPEAEVGIAGVAEHLRALFRAGTPIVGVCAAGALIRILAPLLDDKAAEPPVVAVAEDGSAVVPLLGGHHGANALARRIADALGVAAAVTTAGDLRFGIALDDPPRGWRLAPGADPKRFMADLLAGAAVRLEGAAPWLEGSGLPIVGRSQRESRAAPNPSPSHSPSANGPLPLPQGERGRSERASHRDSVSEEANELPLPLWEREGPAPQAWEGEGVVPPGTSSPWRTIRITPRAEPSTAERLVYHPAALAIGVGCERGAGAGEIESLVRDTLAEAGLALGAVALLVSLDLKMDEAGLHAAAEALGPPVRFFTAAELEKETPRLASPSELVFREVGCHGVAEAAALAAAGAEAALVVAKRKSARATCAVAQGPDVLDPDLIGRRRGTLAVVGIGPGRADWRTPEADRLLAAASDLVGYSLYLDLLGPLAAGKRRHDYRLGEEEARVAAALDLAAEGRDVALVCSGDAGIYAMGSLVFELIDRSDRAEWRRVAVTMAPGISALQAAAARIGAPLGHDFCAISLSDLMTPWPVIERRIRAAAEGDFVIAFYNPVSQRRRAQLARAREILLEQRAAAPVVLGRNLGRDGEQVTVTTLDGLAVDEVDMLTLVLVGSTDSRVLRLGDGSVRVYTPRGYGEREGRRA